MTNTPEEIAMLWEPGKDLYDVATAAAFEAAAKETGEKLQKLSNIWHRLFVECGYDTFANRLKQLTDELTKDVPSDIRALTPADARTALEAVKREAFNDGIEAAARYHDEIFEHDSQGIEYSSLVGIPISNLSDLEASCKKAELDAAAIRALKKGEKQ
jgi:hypothetical protein